MKIFKLVQSHYTLLGINSMHQSAQKYPFNGKILIGFLLLGCSVALHFAYIFYVAEGFMDYMVCICSLCASFQITVCFAAFVFKWPLAFETIGNMEKFINSRCKYPKSRRFFLKTNRLVEQLCGIVFTCIVKVALQCYMLPKCIVSFAAYFVPDSQGSDSFQLPIPLWFPFHTNNPIGYLIAFISEYVLIGFQFFVIACTLGIGMGAFWIAVSATKEFQRILHLINAKSQSNELNILLCEFIEQHGIVKQSEHSTSSLFQPIFMSLFTWSLLSISSALLMIQVEIMRHGSVMPLLLSLLNGIVGLTLALITCELGQRMSDAFDKIDIAMEKIDWYLFPIEVKRILPMLITNAQQPVILECFGSIACTREVFKNIIHSAFSYFMVLRQLGE